LVLVKAKECYRLWHKSIVDLKRVDRYTVGARIDDIFLSLLESLFKACFAYDAFEKLSLVSGAIATADLLRFFLQLAWEEKVISHKCYSALILGLDEVGRMLGGWKKSLNEKTTART